MKKHTNTNNAKLLLGLALVAVAVAGGWIYLSLQKTSLEITTDKPAYFTVDKPEVEIKLHNAAGADSGEITVVYDNKFLTLAEQKNTAGVTIRQLDNKLIFTLSEEFFNAKTETITKLTFESVDFGKTSFELDKTNSKLTAEGKAIQVAEFKDKSIEVGVAPDRGERDVKQASEGSIDSI